MIAARILPAEALRSPTKIKTMIPLRDNIRHKNFPLMTLVLIAINVIVFSVQFYFEVSPKPWRGEILIYLGGIVPSGLWDKKERDTALLELYERASDRLAERYRETPWFFWKRSPQYRAEKVAMEKDFEWAILKGPFLGILVLVSSLFLHGGFFHLLGNMWFLWLFGNNVEDRLGKFRFVLFYLLCGMAAGYTHVWLNQDSPVPTIGASGAIGGVLGAYILLYPHARVLTLIPIVFLIFFREIPAWIFLGIWFLFEFWGAQSELFFRADRAGGVAHWAHVGGFVAGFLLIRFFALGRPSGGRPGIRYTIR